MLTAKLSTQFEVKGGKVYCKCGNHAVKMQDGYLCSGITVRDGCSFKPNPDNKAWYKVRDVEYSTDINFFKENQIWCATNYASHQFNSRLESYCFKWISRRGKVDTLSDQDIELSVNHIHFALLTGLHGDGEFID